MMICRTVYEDLMMLMLVDGVNFNDIEVGIVVFYIAPLLLLIYITCI
jgi:hypothetical protein